jgi:pantoate--beta-alanine ligase
VKTFDSAETINNLIKELKSEGKMIGFVPTMGALHDGHLSMVKQAKSKCDVVVVSVFVNPTQFNNPEDLAKYPRNPEQDATLLKQAGCDFAFFPSVEEVYPTSYQAVNVPLGNIEKVMEGAFRPGHFQGVVEVVARLFEIIQPHIAYFGMKDFQQVAVIKRLVHHLNLPIEIETCAIYRNQDGLALSSRNKRLNAEQLTEALHIYQTLKFAVARASFLPPSQLKTESIAFFNQSKMKLEYLSIVDPLTLEELSENWVNGAVMCIACFCGEIRLIDNMTLN